MAGRIRINKGNFGGSADVDERVLGVTGGNNKQSWGSTRGALDEGEVIECEMGCGVEYSTLCVAAGDVADASAINARVSRDTGASMRLFGRHKGAAVDGWIAMFLRVTSLLVVTSRSNTAAHWGWHLKRPR